MGMVRKGGPTRPRPMYAPKPQTPASIRPSTPPSGERPTLVKAHRPLEKIECGYCGRSSRVDKNVDLDCKSCGAPI